MNDVIVQSFIFAGKNGNRCQNLHVLLHLCHNLRDFCSIANADSSFCKLTGCKCPNIIGVFKKPNDRPPNDEANWLGMISPIRRIRLKRVQHLTSIKAYSARLPQPAFSASSSDRYHYAWNRHMHRTFSYPDGGRQLQPQIKHENQQDSHRTRPMRPIAFNRRCFIS